MGAAWPKAWKPEEEGPPYRWKPVTGVQGWGGAVELEGGEHPGAELSNLDFQGQAGGNLTGDLVIS